MFGRLCSSTMRAVAALTTVGMITAMTGVLAAGSGAAAPAFDEVEKELTYTCNFPLIGNQPVTATVRVGFPDAAAVGERIQPQDLAIDFTLQEEIVTAFRLIGAATLEADAAADVDVAFVGKELTIGVPNLKAPKQDVPASGPLTSTFSGPMPSFIMHEPGELAIAAGPEFHAEVTALDANGNDTALGNPINVGCTQNAGQDPHLVTIPITGESAAATPASVSAADVIEKDLTYSCTFPEVGAQDVTGSIKTTIPDQVTVGVRAEITDAVVDAALNEAIVDVLRNNSAATVAGLGMADLAAVLTDANGRALQITLGLPAVIEPVDVPAEGGLTASLPPEVPTLIFREPGTLSVAAGALNGTFTPRDANGNETGLGTFDVPCQQVPGQDPHLATVQIVS